MTLFNYVLCQAPSSATSLSGVFRRILGYPNGVWSHHVFWLAHHALTWNRSQQFLRDSFFFVFLHFPHSYYQMPVHQSYETLCTLLLFLRVLSFKLGARSDFKHYMMQFSTISSHGLIKVHHRNMISALRIGYRPD